MPVAGALALLAAAALLLAAWRDPPRRAWALVAISGIVLYLALRALPQLTAGDGLPQRGWNWSGHLLALAGMVGLAALLTSRAGLAPRELGFARPTGLRTAVAVCAAALLLSLPLQVVTAGRPAPMTAEGWLFVALAPGLVEEVAFRGVLLAAAERAAPSSRQVAGVRVSLGAALLTAAFVGLHESGVGLLTSVLPGALLYLWLRLRTGSVLAPIVAHNLWNLTVLAAHL
ncbi:MAG: CPBP family intramembrane metalloprotease [Burkholderiaceae bacterium]|nr:CPBP family intramembrane metalloprotease [Burkholderiaceae bacterium]